MKGVFERRFCALVNPCDRLVQVPGSDGFLYYAEYNPQNLNPEIANSYYRRFPQKPSGCSGVYKDGFVLRNFDWTYNEEVEFIARMNRNPFYGVEHSSLGFAAINPGHTRRRMSEIVEGNLLDPYLFILPYSLIDGINDAGIYVQSNAVYTSDVSKIDLNPGKPGCCEQTMVPRMILDRAGSLEDVPSILESLHVYGSSIIKDINLHFLVADKERCFVVEFENDRFDIVEFSVLTNFRLNRGFQVLTDGKPDWETIEDYGMGVERWQIANVGLMNGMSLRDLQDVLRYTNAYMDVEERVGHEAWLTDLCIGKGVTTEMIRDCHLRKDSSPHFSLV